MKRPTSFSALVSRSALALLVPAVALWGAPAVAADPGAAASPATEPGSPVGALTGPQLGAPAPDFSLPTIAGKKVTLSSYRGKTLVLNVWATWCPPCRQEMPDLISTSKALNRGDVVFLGVDSTEAAPLVRAYAEAKGMPYDLAIDGDQTFSKAYDIAYFPTTFVIDPQGVLRARDIDMVTPAVLMSFINAAKAGKNASITSALQTKIDATLHDSTIAFTGDAAANIAAAKAADKAIKTAEAELDDSDNDPANQVDLLRTRAEEASLRDKTIAALSVAASSDADKALLARLRGDAARDREAYTDAMPAYRDSLALDPKNIDTLQNAQYVARKLQQYDAAVDIDKQIVALEPDSPDDLVDLGLDTAKTNAFPDAYAAFTSAVTLAQKQRDAKPDDAKLLRKLAWVHLYFGRTYVKGNDRDHARAEFAQTLALATQLPAKDVRHDMYLEEAQEATVALDLTPNAATTVSLAPWTGVELPGSVPNTIKYRLVVAGAGGKSVALRAGNLPKGWVASFCTDRVCAPFKVSFELPQSGVKVIEFQLVPPNAGAKAEHVRVIENDGSHTASAVT